MREATTQPSTTNAIVLCNEVGTLEMGVLPDGTAYLTQRGLARACGVDHRAISRQAEAWKAGKRDSALARLLQQAGYDEELLYIPIDTDQGQIHAYIDSVCTIIIEYYAFDVNIDTAKRVHRVISRQGLRVLIYQATGYHQGLVPSSAGQQLLERLKTASAPDGYFSVLGETVAFLSSAVENGLSLSSKTVPDISVGLAWGRYWAETTWTRSTASGGGISISTQATTRRQKASPQKIWVYPEDALGEFRRWFRNLYGPNKLPRYLNRKCDQGQISRAEADKLLAAVIPAQLPESADPKPIPLSPRTAPCRLLPAPRGLAVIDRPSAIAGRR